MYGRVGHDGPLVEVVVRADPRGLWSLYEGAPGVQTFPVLDKGNFEDLRQALNSLHGGLVNTGCVVMSTVRVAWPTAVSPAPMSNPDMTLSPWLGEVKAMWVDKIEITPGLFLILTLWQGKGVLPYAASTERWRENAVAADHRRTTWYYGSEEEARERIATWSSKQCQPVAGSNPSDY